MALFRSEEPEPVRSGALAAETERRVAHASLLATGTLACPACDAPVAPAGTLRPAEPLACPYCGHTGAVRDFLDLGAPARAARVDVRVVQTLSSVAPPRRAARRAAPR